jgi:hypothetical protein
MAILHSIRILFLLFISYDVIIAQAPTFFTPAFCLTLSGTGGATSGGKSGSYHYQLSQINGSGVLIVQGRERTLDSARFAKLKKSIMAHVLNLTEESYGAFRDSADFTGELAVTAFERTNIVKFTTALRIGAISDTSMAGLLHLLMGQVEDSLQLHF